MPFRVGQYVTVDKGGVEWHGEIIARLPDAMFQVRVGGTSGGSMITSLVAESRISPMLIPRNAPSSPEVIRQTVIGMVLEETSMQSKSIPERIAIVENSLNGFMDIVDEALPFKENEHRLRGIFLAPEYMFANVKEAITKTSPSTNKVKVVPQQHKPQDIRHLDESAMPGLLDKFQNLSARCRNILIIPGTVAWRRRRSDCQPSGVDQYHQAVTGSVTYFPKPSRAELPSDVNSRSLAFREFYGLVPQTYSEKISSFDTADFFAHNTAFVYYNGINVAKYHKIGDYHEVLGRKDTIHIPSVQPCRFDCGGMKFGLSICLDDDLHATPHGTHVQIQRTSDPVDFHIKLSATAPARIECTNLLPGGFLLSCDADDQVCLVKSATKDIAQFPTKVANLRVFKV